MDARLTAAADSVLRDIVAGRCPMGSGLAVAARIAARAEAQRINAAISDAIEHGADCVDLSMDGGRTWRVHIRQ